MCIREVQTHGGSLSHTYRVFLTNLKPNPQCFLVSGFLEVTKGRLEAYSPNIMALLDREAEDMLSILGMDLKARNPQKIRTFKWSHIPRPIIAKFAKKTIEL